jgi:carbamoyl-phosphate synthase large subunit
MAKELRVVGVMNAQFAIQNDVVYVLEVNPRASRTIPFVSKATGLPLAKIAARAMVGETLEKQGFVEQRVPKYFSVKESVFPFIKFAGADPILGPEMKSTGEVMGIGRTFGEAYAKAQLASGVVLPTKGTALLSVRDRDKEGAVELAQVLVERGFNIIATDGTAKQLAAAGIDCRRANKVREGRPHIVDMIKNNEISLIVNTTEGKQAIRESLSIRAEAVRRNVTYYTTLGAAVATCTALEHLSDSEVNKLQDLHREVAA